MIALQRLCEENERKLKLLSTKITQHNREATAPVKTALLADAKAPREVRRRQIRYGTQHAIHPLPSANEISKARKEIFDKGYSLIRYAFLYLCLLQV